MQPYAAVTFEEMLEHSFYQMLNLAQILYLHACAYLPMTWQHKPWARLLMLAAVTAPWLAGLHSLHSRVSVWSHGPAVALTPGCQFGYTERLSSTGVFTAKSPGEKCQPCWLARPLFPVNRFSHNYVKAGRDPWVGLLHHIRGRGLSDLLHVL